MNKRPGIVFVGMECSGQLRRRFQRLGFETYSCDFKAAEDFPYDSADSDDGLTLGKHIVGDVFEVWNHLLANDLAPAVAIFHPDCTYLTNSAAWAYADPDYERWPGVGYHQKVAAGTLTGARRRAARTQAIDEFAALDALDVPHILENPASGALSVGYRRPDKVLHPYMLGDDASKATGLWARGVKLPPLPDRSSWVEPRWVKGLQRWGNQTDSGQNRLSPGATRAADRSRTYDGIADYLVAVCLPVLEALL